MDVSLLPKDKVGPLMAAVAGVLLSLLMQTALDWRRALTIAAAGLILTYFCTASIAAFFGIRDPNTLGVLGLVLGFSGMYVCGAAMSMLTTFQASPLLLVRRVSQAIWGDKE